MALTKVSFDMINGEYVNVLDYGAIGTDNPANEAADTAAFTAAMATGKNVFVPEGTYYSSQTISISANQVLKGAGRGKTRIYYSGSGTGIYMGSSAPVSLIFKCELHDLTIFCTNRAATVNGVELENCVLFSVSSVTSFGSGSPNSSIPAERVLYGNGIYLHNNTIIGNMRSVESRLWERGFYLNTDTGSQSYWTAALVFDGQCYTENCMRGVVVGDPTSGLYSGVGVAFRDMTIQGCYTSGMNINSGDNTVIDSCYFEGNANYDVTVGSPSGSPMPIGVKIINCTMNSENIGVTPYGNFPYIAKIYVDEGFYTTIRDNNISISSAIPLISLTANSQNASISGNRVNSAISPSTAIINDLGVDSVIYNNYGYTILYQTNPTLLSPWVNSGGGYHVASYTVFENIFGQKQVFVNGTVKDGSAGTAIFQLPPGLRPTGRIEFALGGGAYNCAFVDSTGNVTCSVKATGDFPLDGITFIAEE
jgi:Pectate lyase superfamily protein